MLHWLSINVTGLDSGEWGSKDGLLKIIVMNYLLGSSCQAFAEPLSTKKELEVTGSYTLEAKKWDSFECISKKSSPNYPVFTTHTSALL